MVSLSHGQVHLQGARFGANVAVWGEIQMENQPEQDDAMQIGVFGPVIPEHWWPPAPVGVRLTYVQSLSGPLDIAHLDTWIDEQGMLHVGEGGAS
jgi:hypothetical protein